MKLLPTGTVFDVSRKRDVYGPPSGSYRVFAGKDASVAFGLSSLKEEDAKPDWSSLNEKHLKTLEEWYSFFRKRYNVVGRVADMPERVRSHVWPQAT
jgi:membrane-associated progesterone receptor component